MCTLKFLFSYIYIRVAERKKKERTMKNGKKISLLTFFIIVGLTHNNTVDARGGTGHTSSGSSSTHSVSSSGYHNGGNHHNGYRGRGENNRYYDGYYGNGYDDIIADDVIDEPYYNEGDVVSDVVEDTGLATGGYRRHHGRFRR